ncbi:MAG: ATP-binding protein [Pseudomonadota bacterium]
MSELRDLDLVWLLLCTVLVALMQAGFLCLESGAVRPKNSVSVAVKNLLDLCLSGLLFWLLGYGLIYGTAPTGALGGWIGFSATPGPGLAVEDQVRFIYLLMFCGTAVTIVSGAIAERARLLGYLLLSAVIATAIFPVVAHWVWSEDGWLAQRGFVDFAGATVVHVSGGLMALIACIFVGPRRGRFRQDTTMPASNLTLTAFGTLLIWIGWFGFNGGSYLRFDGGAVTVLLVTAAGAIGGAMAVTAQLGLSGQPLRVEEISSGLLGGLVGITAGAHALDVAPALLLGSLCGLVALYANHALARAGIDDVIGAVAVHACAGIVGTVLFPALADPLRLDTGLNAIEQLKVQLLGVGACVLWILGAGTLLVGIINRLCPLRCKPRQEEQGLDRSEHGANNAWLQLDAQLEASERARVLAQRAKARADAANDAKTAFLANMSHELRTPLNGVIGTLDTVLDDPLEAEMASSLTMARNSGEHLLKLINDLLDVAKFEAGEIELELLPVNIRELAREVQETVAHIAAQKGLALTLKVAPDVPSRALLDPTRVKQILLNLVGNALKFTGEGEVMIQISCLWDDAEDQCMLQLAVHDSGPGIDPKAQEAIFDRFKQADSSTTRRYGGTGLGLTLTRDLVELMDGELTLKSTPGQGACFTARLPVTVVHDDAPVSVTTSSAPHRDLSQLRVLVAEDNPVNRSVVQRMLDKLGITSATVVENGEQAVAQWRLGDFQVVLMDCQMPQMDGLEATIAIREIEATQALVPIPIIACTANASMMDREECLNAGMNLHLSKPLTLATLRTALEAAIEDRAPLPPQSPGALPA